MAAKQQTKTIAAADFFGKPIRLDNHEVLLVEPPCPKTGLITLHLWREPAVRRRHLTDTGQKGKL